MNILVLPLLKRKVTSSALSSRPKVIFELSRELIKKGHDVTILGSADTHIDGAQHLSVVDTDWSSMPAYENVFYAQTAGLTLLANKLKEIGDRYDVIHNHTYPEFINLLVADQIKTPIVTTIHTQPFDLLDETFHQFDSSYLISISKAHRKLFTKTNIHKIVYNGIDTDLYAFKEAKDDYLLWLGRLSKAKNDDGSYQDPKGIKWAIKLAQETGMRLKLSGNIEDMKFFKQDVEPHLNDRIQWIGPVSSELSLKKEQVVELMQNASVFLMTINWYEPFGLVMAESMSCGTPVIGFDRGSVSEIIVDGKTGFIVNPDEGIEGLKSAVEKLSTINPSDCRTHVEQNFSLPVMAQNYENVYKEVIEQHKNC